MAIREPPKRMTFSVYGHFGAEENVDQPCGPAKRQVPCQVGISIQFGSPTWVALIEALAVQAPAPAQPAFAPAEFAHSGAGRLPQGRRQSPPAAAAGDQSFCPFKRNARLDGGHFLEEIHILQI